MEDKEWHRPKKPYTVNVEQRAQQSQGYDSKPYEKKPYDKKPYSKPKQIVIPAKNNANNKALYEAIKANMIVRISINNLLSSDKDLAPVYEGKIKQFDDFTVVLETGIGTFMINKSAIAVLEFISE